MEMNPFKDGGAGGGGLGGRPDLAGHCASPQFPHLWDGDEHHVSCHFRLHGDTHPPAAQSEALRFAEHALPRAATRLPCDLPQDPLAVARWRLWREMRPLPPGLQVKQKRPGAGDGTVEQTETP